MRLNEAEREWERIQRTKDSRPWLIYELGPSERHRPEHEAWAGKVLKVDDPAWGTMFPPNGGCQSI